MHISRDRFAEPVVLWALSLLPLTFVFPSHLTALPYVVLLMVATHALFSHAGARRRYAAFAPVALAFGMYFPYSLASIWLQHGTLKAADNGLHFLFFLVIAICFAELRSQRLFWRGLSAAAWATCALALYQRFGLHIDRPYGMYGINALRLSGSIKFGMVATVFTLLALLVALDRRIAVPDRVWHGSAALAGYAGCLAIGSRGPLLALLIISMGLAAGKISRLHKKQRGRATLAALLGAVLLAALFHTEIAELITLTGADISTMRSGNLETSIGQRLVMWKAALTMFAAHPWFGVGMNQFGNHLHALIAAGQAPAYVAVFGHTHNEYLEALATGGIVGLAYLLWLFGAPLAFFLRHLAQRPADGDPIAALGGLITVLCFAFFAIGDNIFDRQMTTSLFAFLTLGFAVMTARLDKPVDRQPL